jgi:hypothetical protein
LKAGGLPARPTGKKSTHLAKIEAARRANALETLQRHLGQGFAKFVK